MNEMLKELQLKGAVLLAFDEGAWQWRCELRSTGSSMLEYKIKYFAFEPEDAVRQVWFMAKEAETKPFAKAANAILNRLGDDEIPF